MSNTMILIEDYIRRGTLLPSFLLNEAKVYQLIKQSKKYQVPTIEALREVITYLGISFDNLYLSTNPSSPFVYNKEFTYVDIPNLDVNYMKFLNIKKNIHDLTREMENLRNKGDYETIIHLTSNKYTLNVFHDAYEEIPIQQKYKVFRVTYTQMEYGFQAFLPEIIEEVFTLNMDTSFKKNLTTNEEGYIMVYRGEGSKSSGLDEAYSWTTEKRVAKFFANRFDTNGRMYEGKVHIDNVIDFIDDRNESEILVIPENVKEIVELL